MWVTLASLVGCQVLTRFTRACLNLSMILAGYNAKERVFQALKTTCFGWKAKVLFLPSTERLADHPVMILTFCIHIQFLFQTWLKKKLTKRRQKTSNTLQVCSLANVKIQVIFILCAICSSGQLPIFGVIKLFDF